MWLNEGENFSNKIGKISTLKLLAKIKVQVKNGGKKKAGCKNNGGKNMRIKNGDKNKEGVKISGGKKVGVNKNWG